MKVITINDGYKYWHPKMQCILIELSCLNKYRTASIIILNRSQISLVTEWWLHNIGYYITKPFIKYNKYLKQINLRCKDVDLEERK